MAHAVSLPNVAREECIADIRFQTPLRGPRKPNGIHLYINRDSLPGSCKRAAMATRQALPFRGNAGGSGRAAAVDRESSPRGAAHSGVGGSGRGAAP